MHNHNVKRLIGALILCTAAGVTASAWAATPARKEAGNTAVMEALVSLPAKDLQWHEVPGTGGVRAANVRGDIVGKGPYEAFVEFPAGANNPHHFHTQALPSVVLSGVFYAIFEDGKKVRYPAGSYYYIPAKLPHFSGCEPGTSCVLFQYQNDHFDLVPTPAAK